MAPNAAKLAYQDGANPLAVICFRTFVGALALAIYLKLRRESVVPDLRMLKRIATSGMAQVATALGLLGAVAYIDVSLAALIFYLHPFLIAVVGHVRGDTPMKAAGYLAILAALGGLALVLGLDLASIDSAGVVLSIVGMVAITFLVFAVAGVSKYIGPVAANYYMTLWSSFYLLVLLTAAATMGWDDVISLPNSIGGWVAILATGVTTTTGYVLFFVGAGMLGTTRAAVWTTSEPLFAILLAIALVNEWLSPLQWVGVALVILALLKFETASQSGMRPEADRNGK